MMRTAIERLASLKLTLLILAALGAGILLAYAGWLDGTWALALPLALFAV
ncbi:MAG: hypothetical protein H7Z39_05125, partial [Burkholderiaceae bacterium]|nr:hypothetical protein [Burkholderiaceae bacterium]